ncbi:MAG: hypothetical protein ACFCA4_12710 [Cyanophyceae cyanobacterium]
MSSEVEKRAKNAISLIRNGRWDEGTPMLEAALEEASGGEDLEALPLCCLILLSRQ